MLWTLARHPVETRVLVTVRLLPGSRRSTLRATALMLPSPTTLLSGRLVGEGKHVISPSDCLRNLLGCMILDKTVIPPLLSNGEDPPPLMPSLVET